MNKLREYREKYGYSQAYMAAALKIAQSTYHYWESGTRPPTLAALKRMAEIFGVSVDDLYDQEIAASDQSPQSEIITPREKTGRIDRLGVLSDESIQIAMKYETLNPSARAVIRTMMEYEVRQDTYMYAEINKLQAELDAQKQLHDAEMETARLQIARLAADIEAAHAAEQKEEA